METSQNSPTARKGTSGIDIFQIAGKSISGWVPSPKTGDTERVRMPFTSRMEERLSIYLEYHPHVRSYQRGDASPAFAEAYRLTTPLGTPYPIPYTYDGTRHEYLPDYIGTLVDGKLLIAEAGLEKEKSKGKPLAKAEAARNRAKERGGVYWIGTEKNLPLSRHYNLLYLHARREPFKTFPEIAPVLLANWPWGDFRSVKEFVKLLGGRWPEEEVEAVVWKIAGDAAAEGRLLVDLMKVELSLSTPLALLDPGAPPILPDPLPSSLEADEQEGGERPPPGEGDSDAPLGIGSVIQGPTIDTSDWEKETRVRFESKLTAATRVLSGERLRLVAKDCSLAPSTLSRLVKRVAEFGQLACVPYEVRQSRLQLLPEFQRLIRKLYTSPLRPTIKAVHEDVQLRDLAEQLTKKNGYPVPSPSYRQVTYYIESISREEGVIEARSGLKHPPRGPRSPYSFVLSIPFPALICQVDEHTIDLIIVSQDGIPITRRVHAAVLVCVKTGAILAGVLSLDSLKEEDYMRLVKQAMEKKDELVKRYDCKHSWPCYGKPSVIFHDRGKIFTSERARSVLVDRFKIITGQAPPYAPSAKGTVEALFTWTTRKLEHRLPGTTKRSAADRGAYDSHREAEKAGITLDVLEKLFIQAIVDGYMQEWDKLRRAKRVTLWEEAVREKGLPRFMGAPDDLKLLLMKAVNRKNPATGRYAITHGSLSFLGRRYVSPGLLDRLRGREIEIYYDRRDISVIYLFVEGSYVGEAYCTELMGRRTSVWEAQAQNKAQAEQARFATQESLAARQRIVASAQPHKKRTRTEAIRQEQSRQLDRQREEIHPPHVLSKLAAMQPPPSRHLPKAEPDPESDRPVQKLAIRERGEEV